MKTRQKLGEHGNINLLNMHSTPISHSPLAQIKINLLQLVCGRARYPTRTREQIPDLYPEPDPVFRDFTLPGTDLDPTSITRGYPKLPKVRILGVLKFC